MPMVDEVDEARLAPARGGLGGFAQWAAPSLAKGMLPGLIAGVVVGGIGSRVIMRIMALTSAPAVRGAETDFGATVGQITLGGTLFLLILGGILGMAGGIAYLAVRKLLPGPRWAEGLVFGVLVLALVGRLLVVPDNPDFLILSPAGLAVALFSALPILFGLLFVPLQRLFEPPIAALGRPGLLAIPVLIGLAPLILAGGVGALVIAGALLVWTLAPTIGDSAKRALRLGGSVLVAGLAIWTGAVFISGVADIL
jgi:hypothetical protein